MNEQNPAPDHPRPSADSKYGTNAYQSAGEYGTVVERPSQLSRLRTLTVVSLVLYLIYSVVGALIAMDETVIEESMRQTGMLTESQIEEAVEGAAVWGLVTSIGFAVVVALLYVVVIIGISLAKNWGRILGIVLAVIGALVMLFGLLTSLGSLTLVPGLAITSAVITVFWLVVTGWWLVVAFSAPLRRYFAAPRQAPV